MVSDRLVILPLVQYALIRSRRRSLHRAVGYSSLVLAATVAVSGVYVVRMMAYKNMASFRLASVKFVWLDLTGIVLFGVYVAFAIAAARHPAARHGVGGQRLHSARGGPRKSVREPVSPLTPDFDAALYASLIFLEVACAAIIWFEWRLGRVRWPMPVLLGYYLVMHVTLTPLAASKGFQSFSDWFAMVGRSQSG